MATIQRMNAFLTELTVTHRQSGRSEVRSGLADVVCLLAPVEANGERVTASTWMRVIMEDR